jgi:hypothetical protein
MFLPLDPAAPADFDFIIGDWTVRHRRLNARLAGCTDWTEFDGLSSTRKVFGGFGNLEDNLLRFPDGAVRAVALRSYCAKTDTWSIWWVDGRDPTAMDTPVRGRFAAGVGTFFADDFLGDRPIRVRFIWRARGDAGHPTWEQAFSPDGGASWETNWTMEFRRAEVGVRPE